MEQTPECKIHFGGEDMTINEVSKKYNLSQDTLRYYEKIGVIPKVTRTSGGLRDYQDEDLKWVELATCMRNSGLSVEFLVEYSKLFREGNNTFQARIELLKKQVEILDSRKEDIQKAIDKLNYKISRYEEALKTGELIWEREEK